MFPAPKYQGHVEHRRCPQRQTEGGADSLRGQKGHMCQERWGDMPWAPGGPPASNGKGSGKASGRRRLFSCALWRRDWPVQRPRGRNAGAPVENLAAESGTQVWGVERALGGQEC